MCSRLRSHETAPPNALSERSVIQIDVLWRGEILDSGGEVAPCFEALAEDGLVELRTRSLTRPVWLPPHPLDTLDYRWINALALMLFAHALVIVFALGAPARSSPWSDDLFLRHIRLKEVAFTPAPPKPALAASAAAANPAGLRPRASGGKKPPNEFITSLFGDGAVKRAFASGGDGGLSRALAGVRSTVVGDAGTGLGSRGGGPGGGGNSLRSVGIDPIGALDTGYREGVLRGTGLEKSKSDVSIQLRTPEIRGSLEKEVIHDVIRRHINQIRYCYELALIRDAGLFGKISTTFTIGAEGKVMDATVVESTAHDAELEACVRRQVLGWKFPKPRGGGVVIVHYPFILHFAG